MWGVKRKREIKDDSHLFFTFILSVHLRARDEYRENRDFLGGDDVELGVKF